MGNAAELRALMDKVMRNHAAIEPRGFDSQRKRAELHRQWDDLYDDYALEVLTEPERVS